MSLSNPWQTGAQQLNPGTREQLANDLLNLLAVDGPTNSAKGDGDAATWLPPERGYRQVAAVGEPDRRQPPANRADLRAVAGQLGEVGGDGVAGGRGAGRPARSHQAVNSAQALR